MTSSNSDMSICNISRLQQDLTSKKEEVKQISEELNKLNARKRKLVKELKSIEEELDFLSGHESSHSQFEGDQFPWSREMMLKLKSVFKIDTFRSHQKAAINATLSKIDCLLIMPTGNSRAWEVYRVDDIKLTCILIFRWREIIVFSATSNSFRWRHPRHLTTHSSNGRSTTRSPQAEYPSCSIKCSE